MDKVIGIGEYAVSDNEDDIIKTFALASCVAVTAYSPIKKIGGMIHVALPNPSDNENNKSKPGYYATTGIPLLISKMCRELGCTKTELDIKIFGGAESMHDEDVFCIGKRNIKAVTETLSGLSLNIDKADVGGKNSRTIELELATGNIKVSLHPIRI